MSAGRARQAEVGGERGEIEPCAPIEARARVEQLPLEELGRAEPVDDALHGRAARIARRHRPERLGGLGGQRRGDSLLGEARARLARRRLVAGLAVRARARSIAARYRPDRRARTPRPAGPHGLRPRPAPESSSVQRDTLHQSTGSIRASPAKTGSSRYARDDPPGGAESMKSAADAILRTEQATYLDALHSSAVRALAVLGGAAARSDRRPRRARSAPRSHGGARRRARVPDQRPRGGVPPRDRRKDGAARRTSSSSGTNIGYGAIVLARAAGRGRASHHRVPRGPRRGGARLHRRGGALGAHRGAQGMAIGELEKIADPIDLLYVDCVKEEYPRYLELAVPKLSRNGVVVADNVLWRGQVARDIAGRLREGASAGAADASTSRSSRAPTLRRRPAAGRRRGPRRSRVNGVSSSAERPGGGGASA